MFEITEKTLEEAFELWYAELEAEEEDDTITYKDSTPKEQAEYLFSLLKKIKGEK